MLSSRKWHQHVKYSYFGPLAKHFTILRVPAKSCIRHACSISPGYAQRPRTSEFGHGPSGRVSWSLWEWIKRCKRISRNFRKVFASSITNAKIKLLKYIPFIRQWTKSLHYQWHASIILRQVCACKAVKFGRFVTAARKSEWRSQHAMETNISIRRIFIYWMM